MAMLEAAPSQPPPFFNFSTDIIDAWAKERPDADALWCVDAAAGTERKFSFRDLAEQSARAAGLFMNSGICRGDRVLVMLPRIAEWWISTLGLIRIGAVPTPATLLLTERELAYRVGAAGVSGVITTGEGLVKMDGFEGIRFQVGGAQPGAIDFRESLKNAPLTWNAGLTRSGDPGVLYFTSATTGDPKMVLHTQASYGLGHWSTGRLWLDLGPNDIHWNLSDPGWAKAAWSSFYGPWLMGACVFALDSRGKFDPGSALDTLENFPITTWCAPPTALRLVVRQDLSRRRFPNLRHCVAAGEPLNPEVLNRWREATGITLHEGYGQTETVVLAGHFRRVGKPVLPGSLGQATPGVPLRLIDNNFREVPCGEEGEIAVAIEPERPFWLFREYWRNPEETARKFQKGFYLTGDRATRDSDGYLWFVGRKDDVIKSSGYRIGPFEVESALLEHPSVLDVAVIGKADSLRGQIVKACVVLRPGVEPTETLKIELQQHAKRLVAAYKYPREIEFVGELPKTTSGKTRHVALRAQASNEVQSRRE
jgi:acetyl-CoA synthetase/medium-chain acyl-CoA synthetase